MVNADLATQCCGPITPKVFEAPQRDRGLRVLADVLSSQRETHACHRSLSMLCYF
jgi:hypothetical protein